MPPKRSEHSPVQWSLPNTASEFVSSKLELDDSTGHDGALPLCSFDSSAISSGLPWDSQGFALGISDETETGVSETQGLSLPSEPLELDLRDWILRHRAEPPPREDSLDERIGAKGPSPQKTVKHPLTTISHQSRGRECEVPNVKEKWVFSRKIWEAVEEEEHVLLASETKKKQRTATPHQDDNGDYADGLRAKAKPSDLNEVLHTKEESDYDREESLLTIADSETESAVAVDSETEDDSETNNIVESRKEFPSSHSPGLDMNMAAFNVDSLQENSRKGDDMEGRTKPFDLNEALHTKDESDYNGDTSLTTADSETERTVALDSKKEYEPENNSRVESGKEFPSSHSIGLDMNKAAHKKDSFQENLHVSSPSARRIRCNSSTSSSREPLSDCGNLVLHPQQSQQSAGKWLCPRINKKHFKPPLKQLSLNCWLSQPKYFPPNNNCNSS
uniref:Uncharacterized protein n=1 Tax=Picea sitchensis TaxID=3332 RepID=D5AB77_PICSI|nr:unknown [Picea sitchensis]